MVGWSGEQLMQARRQNSASWRNIWGDPTSKKKAEDNSSQSKDNNLGTIRVPCLMVFVSIVTDSASRHSLPCSQVHEDTFT